LDSGRFLSCLIEQRLYAAAYFSSNPACSLSFVVSSDVPALRFFSLPVGHDTSCSLFLFFFFFFFFFATS
jgi:hypothetical protein